MNDAQIEEALLSGFKIVCDECDHIGSNDYGYPMWQLQEDGRVLCEQCVTEVKNTGEANSAN